MAQSPTREEHEDTVHMRGRRASSRLHVRLPARAITLTDTRPAILCDLSLHGAQFDTDAIMQAGAEVLLQWGRQEAFGTVVWSSGRRCGVRFYETLTPDQIIATRDLDDAEHLPPDIDLWRAEAWAWAKGNQRL